MLGRLPAFSSAGDVRSWPCWWATSRQGWVR